MSELSSFELGWLVGILEGEGSFTLECNNPRIKVEITDEDTSYRVAALFERITGKPCHVYDKAPSGNSVQHLFITRIGSRGAKDVMRLVVKYMSHRRRQRIWQCLNGFKSKKLKIDLVQLGLIKEQG